MADTEVPVLPPEEAIAFFRSKGLAKSFAWADVWASQHDYFFTVAKMMSVSLLEDTHALILEALKDGRSPQQLGRELKDLLARRGWWGRRLQADPLTGEAKAVQLGSNRRVRTIVDANLRTSYAAGRWERQERTKAAFPILVYKSRMDGRERAEHRAWHNTALYFDHQWWLTHYTPCGFGCRCLTLSMTLEMAQRRGLEVGATPPDFGKRRWVNKRTGEVMEIERGIGAGWDYHPGRAKLEGIAPDPLFGFSKGDEDSVAAAEPTAVERFLRRFGIDGEGVWRDAAGWPLPISRAWLKGLTRREQGDAASAAIAIASPDEIRLVWVIGKDGRAMLMRRYILAAGETAFVVDVGTSAWRFRRVTSAQIAKLQIGAVTWSRDGSAIAAYDPAQPRDPKGRWARVGWSSPITSLVSPITSEEQSALTHYTGDGYEEINGTLRGFHDPLDFNDVDHHVSLIDGAVAKGRITEDVRLYRGVNEDALFQLEQLDLTVGSVIQEPGFSSTSKFWVEADRFAGGTRRRGLLFIVHAKAGMKALDVTHLSSVGTGEYEVLFPRNQRWKIRSLDFERRVFEIDPEE